MPTTKLPEEVLLKAKKSEQSGEWWWVCGEKVGRERACGGGRIREG